MISGMEVLVKGADAPVTYLPEAEPLTLTRNFGMIVGACLAILVVAPLVIAWTASMLLT